MCTRRSIRLALFVVIAVTAVSTAAQAQSAIAGIVRDTSGAVLPGVTAEATSPALIEKVRTVVSDEQGQYRIADVRPGTYVVTFTLPGFTTVRREGIVLEANFTANVSVELRVGAIEETVTVSGAAPVVDVQTTQKRAVLNRELLESLPTGDRSFSTNTVPAILRAADVGGASQMSHNGMTAYGLTANSDILVDGMSIVSGRGSPGFYLNVDAAEESVYQIGGGSAEASTGGVIVNMIPRQGGNKVSGNVITILTNQSLQGSNYSDDLAKRGLITPASLSEQWDFNASVGGPIIRDRLWFFVSHRHWGVNNYVADTFNPDGSQAKEDNYIFAFTGRLTYQLTPKNKITALYDRMHKNQGHRDLAAGVSPEATRFSYTPLPVAAQAKWTSTVTNSMLVEAGLSANLHRTWQKYREEVDVATCFTAFLLCAPGTDYGDIAKQDLLRGTSWNAHAAGEEKLMIPAYHFVSSVSYITGAHALKTGFQLNSGYQSRQVPRLNGDLVQQYRNGVPDSVLVNNTPNWSEELNSGTRTNLDYDIGVFLQDSWTMRRLTLSPGVRVDLLANSFPEQRVQAGRFVAARNFPAVPNIINWKDWSPRVGAAYDLFGNGKTALKANVGKYVQLEQSETALRYNPLVSTTDSRTWRDTNGDDIAQESEIGPSTNATFGVRRNVNPDPELKRPYTWLSSVGVQRELWSGASLSVTYNRRDFRRLFITDNLPLSLADYTLVTVADPRGNGQTLPVYNLNVAKRGLLDELDTNSDSNKRTYTGVDASVSSRFGRGGTMMVGTSTGRLLGVNCQVDDANLQRFCDQTEFDIPFRTSLRVVANYPMPYGIRLAGVFQSVPGLELPTNYVVNRTIVPSLTQTSVTVRLDEPGQQYRDRVNQLDVSVGREFSVRNVRITPKLNLYNALNVNPVLTDVTTFGSSLGRPQSVLPARIVHFNVLVKF
jgi:hypothetical protein